MSVHSSLDSRITGYDLKALRLQVSGASDKSPGPAMKYTCPFDLSHDSVSPETNSTVPKYEQVDAVV